MDERTCIWPDCSQSERLRRDLCRKHYLRAWRLGDFEEPWESWKPRLKPTCSEAGCEREHKSKGWCSVHYGRYVARQGRLLRSERERAQCAWPECEALVENRKLCKNHYQCARRIGDFETPWETWLKTCFVCGVTYSPIRHRISESEQSYCSASCRSKGKRILHPERERERSRNREYRKRTQTREGDDVSRAALRERDGDGCYLCDELIDFELRWPHSMSPSLDHKRPLSKGGEHSLLNTAMTHLTCNLRKGDQVIEMKEDA